VEQNGEEVVGQHAIDDLGDVGKQLVEVERERGGGGDLEEKIEQLAALSETDRGFAGSLHSSGSGGFDDFNAGTGADASGAGSGHGLQILQGADAAGGLHAHGRANGGAHEGDIVSGGAGGGESGGGLDEFGARGFGDLAGEGLLGVVEQRGFEDHL